MNLFSQEFLIPDSVNWNFANSSNTVSASDGQLFYASNKKVVVLCQRTGTCTNLIHNRSSASVVFVTCNQQFVATYSSDHKIRLYEQGKFQEAGFFDLPDCLGLKFRGNDLICVGKEWCKVFNNSVLLNEYKLEGFSCIETYNELIGISQETKTVVFKLLESLLIPFRFSSMALQNLDSVYLAGFTSTSVKVFKDLQEIAEIPMKKTQIKMKNPIYSVIWLGKNRLVYSTLPGDLVLVQIEPLVTQSFMNNPHTKAILSLSFTHLGLFSCGMDRFICCWDISDIDTSIKCPRSYSSVLAYTEPVWELQTLEANIHSLTVSNEKLIVSCGKSHLQLFSLSSMNMHSRSIQKISNFNITHVKASPSSELLAIITTNDLILFSLPQEKVLNCVKSPLSNIYWTDNESLIGYHNTKVFRISVQGIVEEIADSTFEISALLPYEDTVFIGTVEGNVFGFEVNGWKRFLVSVVHNRKISCLQFGQALVAGSEDGCLSVYRENTLMLEQHYKAVFSVAWVKELVVSGSLDHTLQVWDSVSGDPLLNFRDFQGAIRSILPINLETKTIVTGSDDQNVRIFSLLKVTNANAPPKFPGNHKTGVVKTLFPELHKLIYQQTKESAYSSILHILKQEKTVESSIFLLKLIPIPEITEIFPINELKIWSKILERNSEPEIIQSVPKDLVEFSFLIGSSALNTYSQQKSEECLLKRKIHNCVIWQLLSGNSEESVKLYISHKLYIEALVLCRLFNLDNSLVYKNWIKRFLSTNKKEQAIKCYIALEDYQTGLSLLETLPQTTETTEIQSLILSKI